MKRFLLFTGFLFSFFIGFGQCPTDSILLTSQADIDNFSVNFPDCTSITNGLTISGDDIVDLSPLSVLSSISQELTIINNPMLSSIEGFDNVDFIEMVLTIENNSTLLSIQGLSDTGDVTTEGVYQFFIKNNPNLLNLEGINLFSSSGLDVFVENNNSLIDLSGISVNASINNLVVLNNENLTNLSGIEVLLDTFEVLDFDIKDNPNLTSLGIDNLIRVNGFLNIENNPSLMVLDLNTIDTVEFLSIKNNNSLDNLEGLESLRGSGIDLFIDNNENLTSLSGLSGLEEMPATLKISNNPNLISLNGLNTSVNPITFDIIIDNNDSLASLDGLQVLQETFLLEIRNNDNLMTFEGLNNLSSAESMHIINNNSLSNFNELVNLTSEFVGAIDLRIEENDNLSDISGVSSLDLSEIDVLNIIGNSMLSECAIENICTYLNTNTNNMVINNNAPQCNTVEEVQQVCNPCLTLETIILTTQAEVNEYAVQFPDCDIIQGTLRISGDDIVDLSPLSSVTTVGDLEIVDNTSLENLDGLALMSIGKTTPDSEPIFAISGNPSLENLDGLSQLFEIEAKTFDISNNPLLTNLDVFNNVSIEIDFVDAILKIDNNASLVTMNGFNELISFSGDLTISNNPLLESLTSNLGIEASDVVSIINNEQLISLEGLNNLSSVITLNITNNSQLSDITAISNALSNDSNIELIITDNPLLETCSFEAMCAFLSANVIEAVIENNGIGCTSVEEVEENCLANFNIISGNILFDFNNDGCTTDDYDAENILVQTTNGEETQISITDEEGNFSFFVDEGVYTTSIISESLPIEFQGVPESIESTFTGLGNEEMIDFCVEAIEVVNDIAITVIPLQEPRPGFDALYVISYSNVGATVESGTITMNFDEEILFYENSSLPPFIIDATFIEWEYDELLPFETRSFEVGFEVFTPPTVQDGNILVSEVEITTSIEDSNPDNNEFTLIETVVNSYDPNDKQVLQGERILEEEVGDYLGYVVRFQNTGTADAINVIVTDTLSDNLNWNSLRILSSSDDYRVEITNENEVNFIFENINLPPEEQDEEGSNGYIAFQIRSNDDLVLGDAIENTANIFFDFNAPIITNTVVTTVSLPLSLEDNILRDAIAVYPNPTAGILNITLASDIQLQDVEIFSIAGKKVIIAKDETLDFSKLSNGIYFARIITNQGTVVKKIVKK